MMELAIGIIIGAVAVETYWVIWKLPEIRAEAWRESHHLTRNAVRKEFTDEGLR